MLEIIVDSISTSTPYGGGLTISLAVNEESREDVRKHILDYQDKKLLVDMKRYRDHRSLNANNYFWRLCTLIAAKLNTDKDDIYRQFIKEAAIVDVYVDKEWENEKVDGVIKMWSGRGTGWVCEILDKSEEYSLLRLYMGSSQYNSLQMYQLIQKTIREAEDLGIPTITEKEAKKMVDRWKQR